MDFASKLGVFNSVQNFLKLLSWFHAKGNQIISCHEFGWVKVFLTHVRIKSGQEFKRPVADGSVMSLDTHSVQLQSIGKKRLSHQALQYVHAIVFRYCRDAMLQPQD